MKNKFKKSKIIVPALALITATTVASVTGTVAWYTASRTATISATSFESRSMTSSLKVATSPLVGTKNGTTTASAFASININGNLTHGSYNAQAITTEESPNEGDLYVAKINDDGNEVVGYESKGTLSNAYSTSSGQVVDTSCAWLADTYTNSSNENVKVWYAVAWKMTFEVDSLGNHGVGLFFDPSATTFTDSLNGDAKQGLRIAFMTSTNVRVVGGLETGEKHVKSTWNKSTTDESANSYTEAFGTGIYHYVGETSYTKATDGTSTTLANNTGYLGSFEAVTTGSDDTTTTKNVLEVTAVAWYEGEDSSIAKDKSMSNVTANLAFYSRNYTA